MLDGFSLRVRQLHSSPVREILAVIGRPGMVSFAGGLPATETFPDLSLAELPRDCLQYGPSEGEPALRAAIADELAARGLSCPPERILLLSGSQQGIDLVSKLYIDPGTPVAVETPTYLAALQVFRFFGARLQGLDVLHGAREQAGDARPAFAYAIPTFQNPTGHCYSDAERAALAAVCDARGIALFEDDPYRDLVYDECERRPVCARLQSAPWIYQGSFSKSLAPGLRLGFLAASAEVFPYLYRLKQAADLHSSRLSQWLVLQQLTDAGQAARLRDLAAFYRERRDRFAELLQRHFADLATWTVPRGGLFFWLELNGSVDCSQLLPAALERGVAFMPGTPFFPEAGAGTTSLRLNFSHASAADADRGLAVLADLIRQRGR
jgi:DNA-binding transcriptional MocR family regulator